MTKGQSHSIKHKNN